MVLLRVGDTVGMTGHYLLETHEPYKQSLAFAIFLPRLARSAISFSTHFISVLNNWFPHGHFCRYVHEHQASQARSKATARFCCKFAEKHETNIGGSRCNAEEWRPITDTVRGVEVNEL